MFFPTACKNWLHSFHLIKKTADKEKRMNQFFRNALTVLLCAFLFTPPSAAADQDKVVLHVNTPQKMTMLVNNVKNLRSKLGPDADIAVVINGPAVIRFSTLAESREQLDELLTEKAEVMICSYAMSNRNLTRVQLLEGTQFLENGGVAKLVELQQDGYVYIKP
jgi:intracellular sulfur oxidation DsrE/DsrF family protein